MEQASNSVVVAIILVVFTALFYVFFQKQPTTPSTPTADKQPASEQEVVQGSPVVFRGNLTLDEVARHNSPTDAWIIVEGKVYDVTTYVDIHPGGDTILNNVGGDSTEGFRGPQHPISADDVLATYYIGDVTGS
mmetsp:Transcript_3044/g.4651  ORF Transcript_3044/g.4651 Transcript_3044/m.4651 type:complete len:134 (+) Transcript_3044:62-463(+)|eukprot:CAMPEP_0185024302 /NCGR_PEP_ID=MMETSP1103-20130426/7322_1 /TAXON_ID=36769 /ORGANISM="Paraphysomonas bandaiensis, Strain Caron Lab Isolate" /LENGTH=133 /DNA_ID=CAMNT_0027557229 /DNA_START=33 /DNA_END=434 /DNA_ORIENTATION=+